MIEGEVRMLDLSERVAAQISTASHKGALLGAEHILGLSQDRVPIEEGTLERSGQVTTDGAGVVAVSYDTPYAIRQHEDLNLRHDSGRAAKYLETAAADGAPQVAAIVAKQLRAEGG